MHRLARVVPIVVGLFTALLVVLLVMAKSRTAPPPERIPQAAGAAGADLRMKEVEIEEQSGSVRWRLKAEQALVYEREGRTSLKKISVVVYDRDRTWTIAADEGDVRDRAPRIKDVEVRENVVVNSSDGYRLETSLLRWDGEGRRLWTDVPVTLTRAGTVIRGSTFELTTGDERATMQRVQAVFALERAR
jgi:LPS export ABC transporter protein LptC